MKECSCPEKGDDVLDKEATSYDVFDAFRLVMKMYYFHSKDDDYRKHASFIQLFYKICNMY